MKGIKTITINVLLCDIEKGLKGYCDLCAVACAVTRQLKPVLVAVSHFDIELSNHDTTTYIRPSPINAARYAAFIEEFDEGKPVKPSSFTFVKV